MLATLAKQRGAVRLVVVGPRDQRPLMDAALDRGRDIGLQVSSVLHTPTQSAATIASKVVRSSADAILLASREQATSILRELLVRGLPATVLLSPGAATSIVSRDLRRGTLDGALTVELDLRVPRELAKRVRAIAPTAPETAYSPQAYDAAAITILAAEQSGRVFGEISPEGIGAALPAVTSVGTACETLATCLRLLRQGADIDYVGYVGPYELDLKGDPRAARYLVRVFTDANKPGSSARPVRYP
jgi:branched-chain amino acid transport system substrate-binding protein